jgi:hypothetical protein
VKSGHGYRSTAIDLYDCIGFTENREWKEAGSCYPYEASVRCLFREENDVNLSSQL